MKTLQKTSQIYPKIGQIWQPKDPERESVVVSSVQKDCVCLQYQSALEVSFFMDLTAFLKHYQYSHHRLFAPRNQPSCAVFA